MEILNNFSLKNHNTFGIDVAAKRFVSITSVEELQELLVHHKNENLFLLGGGSNMLLTQDVKSLVVHLNLRGITIEKETDDVVWVAGMAGENWHEFVLWTLKNDFGGLENLSLIPGNVGTTPVQNIGAYGVEIKDTMVYCEAVALNTGALVKFSNEACKFGYRDSIFKQEAKNKYAIVKVVFELSKRNHKRNTSYGAIESALESKGITQPSIQDVSDAVISIRSEKLPDPKVLGNSGSFFKNPVIPKTQYQDLLKNFPAMPHYIVNETLVKVPAGWLIEQAGFKGKKIGHAGIHEKQALVLVNYGGATGAEIWALAQHIQQTVFEKYNIFIEAEVNVI